MSLLGRLVGRKVPIGEMLKKLPNFCSNGYFEFWPQNQYKGVKIYSPDLLFFSFFFGLTGFRLMADQVIFDIGQVVDKAYIYTMKGRW